LPILALPTELDSTWQSESMVLGAPPGQVTVGSASPTLDMVITVPPAEFLKTMLMLSLSVSICENV
jgi:hypothetical protein